MLNPGLQTAVTHLNKYGSLCPEQPQEGKVCNISDKDQILPCKRFPLNHPEPDSVCARVDEGCTKQGGKDERVTAVLLGRGMKLLQRKSEVINYSVTMAESWLRNVDGVG